MRSPIKLLVVDDDDFLREILEKCLTTMGHQVMGVSSVEFAKRAVDVYVPDLILSDVQMPGASGVDFLKWLQAKSCKIPVVIMTGFSDLMNASTAASAGARAFLAKPFSQTELEDTIRQVLLGGTAGDLANGTSPPRDRDDSRFMKVSINDFVGGSQIRAAIHLRLNVDGESKYVKVAQQGEDLSLERIRAYTEKGVQHVYLLKEDYISYIGLTVKIAQAATEMPAFNDEKKAHLCKHTIDLIGQLFKEIGVSPIAFEHALTITETSLRLFMESDQAYLLVSSLRDVSNETFVHSAAVCVISILNAKSIGWTATRTLTKVALAGMLHDIGKHQLPPELVSKHVAAMNAAERKEYETHPQKGMEMLAELPILPSDVVQAVYQHHERSNGKGFPAKLTDGRIAPLAKLIAVSDEFCHLFLSGPGREQKDVIAALARLVELHSEGLSSEMITSLHSAFNVAIPQAPRRSVGR